MSNDANESYVLSEETINALLAMDEAERPQKVLIEASDHEKLQKLAWNTKNAIIEASTHLKSRRYDWVIGVTTEAIDNVEGSRIAKQALRYPLGLLYGLRARSQDVASKRIEDLENAVQNLSEFSDPEIEKAASHYREAFEELLLKTKETESSGGMCFIATAAYGSEMAPEVIMLRQFRDQFLRPSRIGALFIQVYERLSPPLAQWLSRHETWRWWVREGIIKPLARVLQRLVSRID